MSIQKCGNLKLSFRLREDPSAVCHLDAFGPVPVFRSPFDRCRNSDISIRISKLVYNSLGTV